MSALSKIYGKQDERPWYVRFPLSVGIAIVVLAALVGAAFLILGLKHAVHGSWGLPLSIARWLSTVALLTAAFGVLVRYAPEHSQSKKWASAGAALVVVTWIAQSLLFAFYVKDLADYKTAVGSLLLVYVITTFAYVGSIVLMVGVELDEQLRRDLQGKDERGILEMARDVL
jgi:membrane protein